ncbi:MAG: MBL fold metallo-hydrolase [Syntrophomonas sp.]
MYSNHDDLIFTKGSREMPWNPGSCMNVYYYFMDGVLIDTGPSNLADVSIPFFKQHPIQQVVLTHIHEDHSGMAAWLQKNKQVPIYLHPGSLEEALKEPELAAYRIDIWGRRRAFEAAPMPDNLYGDKYIFNIIDTPGHYRHHKAVFLKEKGWLFSGDLITVLRPTAIFSDENLTEMISSIQNLLSLPFNTVLCAHTGIHRNGRDLFTRKLDYLLSLQAQILELRADGLSNVEICQKLFPQSDSLNSVIALDFSSLNIVATL